MEKQQQTSAPTYMNNRRERRRGIAETAILLLLCSASVSGFAVGGATPLTRKLAVAKSYNRHVEPNTEESNSQTKRKLPWKKNKQQNLSKDENFQTEDEAVDEYLEFLDRRYRRLHDDELKSSEQVKPSFSAWNWLHQEPIKEAVEPQQTQADALYVLGVAGLASKKLLQKHQIQMSKVNRRPKKQTMDEVARANAIDVVSDESASEVQQLSGWSKKKQLVATKLTNAFTSVSNKRKALLEFQKRQLADLIRTAMVGITRGPKGVALKLWNLGGGKRNMMFTASLLVAFTFVIIQPLLKTAAREGLNMTVG